MEYRGDDSCRVTSGSACGVHQQERRDSDASVYVPRRIIALTNASSKTSIQPDGVRSTSVSTQPAFGITGPSGAASLLDTTWWTRYTSVRHMRQARDINCADRACPSYGVAFDRILSVNFGCAYSSVSRSEYTE